MIQLKTEEDINGIRKSCHMLCRLLDSIEEGNRIKPGISTKDIDKYCYEWIIRNGGKPACLNYEGFPATACISLNDEIIHGIPSVKRIIHDGDIVSVDLCINLNGYISDSARTFIVGNVAPITKKLVTVTKECLYRGIEAAGKKGARVSDIGMAVSSHAERNGFSPIREYCGHGVGFELHEDPEIPNYISHSLGNPRIREGMVFAIEPMINQGSRKIYDNDPDGWTVRTADGKPSAHFEHTVAITSNGLEILTQI